MSRLSELTPDVMDAEQRRVYDDIVSGPRGAGLRGPFNALLRSPGLCDHVQKVGAFIRYESLLPGKLRELAIIITARHWRAQYEWYAHSNIARQEGLDDAIIDAIANKVRPTFTEPAEAVIYDFCSTTFRDGEATEEAYQAAFAEFGEKGVVELVGLMGYYCLVALTLNTFQVPLPEGATPLS